MHGKEEMWNTIEIVSSWQNSSSGHLMVVTNRESNPSWPSSNEPHFLVADSASNTWVDSHTYYFCFCQSAWDQASDTWTPLWGGGRLCSPPKTTICYFIYKQHSPSYPRLWEELSHEKLQIYSHWEHKRETSHLFEWSGVILIIGPSFIEHL